MILRLIKSIFILVSLIFVISCNTEKACIEYNEERQTYLQMHFYSLYTLNDKLLTADSILPQIAWINADTIYKKASSLIVPLSQTNDTTHYNFTFNQHPESICTIISKRNRVFISYECGFRTDFVIDSIYFSPNPFDSIEIVRPVVTDANEEHIKIYFNRPVVSRNP